MLVYVKQQTSNTYSYMYYPWVPDDSIADMCSICVLCDVFSLFLTLTYSSPAPERLLRVRFPRADSRYVWYKGKSEGVLRLEIYVGGRWAISSYVFFLSRDKSGIVVGV